jgi:drug/metabolite transporter superfamily protein YnfA
MFNATSSSPRARASAASSKSAQTSTVAQLQPVAGLQPDAHFGRVLAAYGGVFIVGALL